MAESVPTVDVTTFGELLGVLTPTTAGPLQDVRLLDKQVGGAEVNVAIGLTRLGHRAAWCGRLGRDPFGTEGLRLLAGEGVDVSRVVVDEHAPTGIYVKEFAAPDDVTSTTTAPARRPATAASTSWTWTTCCPDSCCTSPGSPRCCRGRAAIWWTG